MHKNIKTDVGMLMKIYEKRKINEIFYKYIFFKI